MSKKLSALVLAFTLANCAVLPQGSDTAKKPQGEPEAKTVTLRAPLRKLVIIGGTVPFGEKATEENVRAFEAEGIIGYDKKGQLQGCTEVVDPISGAEVLPSEFEVAYTAAGLRVPDKIEGRGCAPLEEDDLTTGKAFEKKTGPASAAPIAPKSLGTEPLQPL